MAKRRTPWLTQPFTFKPFFSYATGLPRSAATKKPPPRDVITTQAVGEEGTGTPPPPGKTTPAIGEEGVGDVPTTTIAKGEEGK
jgi:hypothetical protein